MKKRRNPRLRRTNAGQTEGSDRTTHDLLPRGVFLNPNGSLNDSELEFFPPGANPTSKARGGWSLTATKTRRDKLSRAKIGLRRCSP